MGVVSKTEFDNVLNDNYVILQTQFSQALGILIDGTRVIFPHCYDSLIEMNGMKCLARADNYSVFEVNTEVLLQTNVPEISVYGCGSGDALALFPLLNAFRMQEAKS